MKINVPHVAKLANLTLAPLQIKKFEKQLQVVLDYIEKLNEIETKNVEETSQITGLENVLREDKANSSRILSQEEALINASDKENGLFKAKRVFNE